MRQQDYTPRFDAFLCIMHGPSISDAARMSRHYPGKYFILSEYIRAHVHKVHKRTFDRRKMYSPSIFDNLCLNLPSSFSPSCFQESARVARAFKEIECVCILKH